MEATTDCARTRLLRARGRIGDLSEAKSVFIGVETDDGSGAGEVSGMKGRDDRLVIEIVVRGRKL